MDAFLAAILASATAEDLAAIPLPDSYRGAVVRRSDVAMFEGLPTAEKDPRRSLSIAEVEVPEMAPDEALVAVMASSINFNTVWSAIFEPLATFEFLRRLGREGYWGARHDRDLHVLGSDASGVVIRVGSAVRNWRVGDEVVVHCNYVDDQDPTAHDDSMLAANQRIWGYESNFGGLAELSLVKANQLMPKPAHLSWEEAAVNALTNSTSYRMLISPNGANMRLGDVVLVWGAVGGLGGYALQYVLAAGGVPVGVVSSARKAELARALGCEAVLDRSERDYRFFGADGKADPSEWRRLGADIRSLVGEDPDIVFEHPGRETFGASVYVAKRGGTVVTCAATSGYEVTYDNRHLWMKLKTIKGSHFANYAEAWAANKLICQGRIQPVLSATFPLEEVGEAAWQVHRNLHEGKIGVRCLAPEDGLGIRDPELRERIGEERITTFRRLGA